MWKGYGEGSMRVIFPTDNFSKSDREDFIKEKEIQWLDNMDDWMRDQVLGISVMHNIYNMDNDDDVVSDCLNCDNIIKRMHENYGILEEEDK